MKKFEPDAELLLTYLDKILWNVKPKFIDDKKPITVIGYQCLKCKDIVFSRARHDCRGCSCESLFVDGGFDYNKISYSPERKPPKLIHIEINVSKGELFNDWNYGKNEYGIIKKGEKPKWLLKKYRNKPNN